MIIVLVVMTIKQEDGKGKGCPTQLQTHSMNHHLLLWVHERVEKCKCHSILVFSPYSLLESSNMIIGKRQKHYLTHLEVILSPSKNQHYWKYQWVSDMTCWPSFAYTIIPFMIPPSLISYLSFSSSYWLNFTFPYYHPSLNLISHSLRSKLTRESKMFTL